MELNLLGGRHQDILQVGWQMTKKFGLLVFLHVCLPATKSLHHS